VEIETVISILHQKKRSGRRVADDTQSKECLRRLSL